MLHVQVPATTANMGPGFDAIGMAFQLYNHLWVEVLDEGLEIKVRINPGNAIPCDETNLIYKSICHFYQETGIGPVPGLRLIQEDYIPLTRGLGSSAACIVAGLLAANEISNTKLSRDELAFMAATMEGHPDNTSPAILGGMIIGVLTSSALHYTKIANHHINSIQFAVMIPSFTLCTEKARNVLPENYKREDVVFNASRAALMTTAFMTGNFELLTDAMDDRIHQPYRSSLIPHMENIFRQAKMLGAKNVFLSGAGPTLIAVTNNDSFCLHMKDYLNTLPDSWIISFVSPDLTGARIIYDDNGHDNGHDGGHGDGHDDNDDNVHYHGE